MTQMTLPLIHHWSEIRPGTIVRGNWSSIEYKVEHVGSCKFGGWVAARNSKNKLQTGCFSYLGKRNENNEITITDPKRPKDRLIIVREPPDTRKSRK